MKEHPAISKYTNAIAAAIKHMEVTGSLMEVFDLIFEAGLELIQTPASELDDVERRLHASVVENTKIYLERKAQRGALKHH